MVSEYFLYVFLQNGIFIREGLIHLKRHYTQSIGDQMCNLKFIDASDTKLGSTHSILRPFCAVFKYQPLLTISKKGTCFTEIIQDPWMEP